MVLSCTKIGTLIYHSPCHPGLGKVEEVMTILRNRNALAILLVAVSLLALAPAFISARNQNQPGTMQINATGQATPLNKGKGTGGSATLSLAGTALIDSNGQLKLQGLTGLLMIGSTNYPVSDGQGVVNNKGTAEINAKTNGGNQKGELILHGSLQGGNVMFSSPESKLASLFFLALSGQASITPSGATNSNTSQGATTTVTQNITITQTSVVTSTQNNTIIQNVTQTVNNTITETETLNQTITQTLTVPTTITTTETLNQTITVTHTQTANATITVTITTTTNATTTGP
jgi:hypothetical protein